MNPDPQTETAGLLRLISTLQNTVTPASRRGWYYLDEDGSTQGPYPPAWMHHWSQHGFFDENTQVFTAFASPNGFICFDRRW